jgi:hypothetical protein
MIVVLGCIIENKWKVSRWYVTPPVTGGIIGRHSSISVDKTKVFSKYLVFICLCYFHEYRFYICGVFTVKLMVITFIYAWIARRVVKKSSSTGIV